jgi:hypothetical protein
MADTEMSAADGLRKDDEPTAETPLLQAESPGIPVASKPLTALLILTFILRIPHLILWLVIPVLIGMLTVEHHTHPCHYHPEDPRCRTHGQEPLDKVPWQYYVVMIAVWLC